ncbi:MAG: SEC-C metal-binding domain-containing protein, partial [Myxococcota bacterium]
EMIFRVRQNEWQFNERIWSDEMVRLEDINPKLAEAQTRVIRVVDEDGEFLAGWRCGESISPVMGRPEQVTLHLEDIDTGEEHFEYHVGLEEGAPPVCLMVARGRDYFYGSWVDSLLWEAVNGDYRERLREHAQLMYARSQADGPGATWRPFERVEEEPGRNDPCPCGSGRKYKKCHLRAVDRGEVTIAELGVERDGEPEVDPDYGVEVDGRAFRVLRDQDDDFELDELLESLRNCGVERTRDQLAADLDEHGFRAIFKVWSADDEATSEMVSWLQCGLAMALMKHLVPEKYALAEIGHELDRVNRQGTIGQLLERGAELLASMNDIVATMDPASRTLYDLGVHTLYPGEFGEFIVGLYGEALNHAEPGDERLERFFAELERFYDLLEEVPDRLRGDWACRRVEVRDVLLEDSQGALDLAREAVEALPGHTNLALTYTGLVLDVGPQQTDVEEAERAIEVLERSTEGGEDGFHAKAVKRHAKRLRALVEDIRSFQAD